MRNINQRLSVILANTLTVACVALTICSAVFAQNQKTRDFRSIVEQRLRDNNKQSLAEVCPIDADAVAHRVFVEYGAIFVANSGLMPPYRCIFTSDAEVRTFQQWAGSVTGTIGGASVTLQKDAMTAILAAGREAAKLGVAITPRGGVEASTRSYSDTARLWRSRFEPALKFWTAKGKIKPADAAAARRMPIDEQIAAVLDWERQGLYFSTDMSKSILYSVAAPGASQHIFMLALDVAQFANPVVRAILARHGWFQTVKSDLPHFTYLGVSEGALRSLGLRPEVVSGQKFWIPDME